MQEAKAGLELHLWGMEQDGEAIPDPTALDAITIKANESICFIEVNMRSIRLNPNFYNINDKSNKSAKEKLLQALAEGEADASEDGWHTLEELERTLRRIN